jgi:hypothetical protein
MTPSRPPRRTPAPGLKSLISAAAVAVTLGGWAVIARADPAPAPEAARVEVSESLPPIPTIVPLGNAPAARPAPAPARPAPITVTRSSR